MKMKRFAESRWIPEGSAKVASKLSDCAVYLWGGKSGRPCAIGYRGKSIKRAFNYSFRDDAKRAAYVAEWIKGCDASAVQRSQAAADKRAKLAKPHGLKVGDVLYTSWGYDQTNIDYYQVVELVGKRSVRICEIGCESIETMSMQGKSVPAVGTFIGEPMLKKVSEYDSVRIASYASASKVEQVVIDGVPIGYKPQHWTAYA